ncbi:hypothetical protein OpiT1DRAFT_05286 [Opitutaceae bacterium TAV1]|nr:hypothetical protein OpiT1DRAFT_05286 [Opitutaceae bacterium TAV1]
MNTRFFTGYLPRDAAPAFTPPAEGASAVKKLLFDVVIRDSRGVEFPEKCVLEEASLMRDYEPLLTAGRAVIVEGEQTARPFYKSGMLAGHVREVRVRRMEFPARGGKRAADAEGGEE